METLIYEKRKGVGFVTLNRPEHLNVLNRKVFCELNEFITILENDDGIGAVILTGAGEWAFSAGADVTELAALDGAGAAAYFAFGGAVLRKLEKMEKPVIAAINGYALGGGLELALACDIRVASDTALFGCPETGLGSIPGFGGTQRLPRLVGAAFAKEMIFTASPIDSHEALRRGLVNRVVPPGKLMEACRALASQMLKVSPAALAFAKKTVDEGLQKDLDSALEAERANAGRCHDGPEYKAFMNAFLNRLQKN